ncbi:MAG: hypothetical protein K2L45_02185 [Muribaculaceae bacterium]|nr:hypothetical protein [Muribaculaceae bacterium]
MGIFRFGKSYTKEDLDKEVVKMRSLYLEAMSHPSSQLKKDLAVQLNKVLEVCKKGDFKGWETVEWPTPGCFTSLQSVTPPVQMLIELM